MKVYRFFIHSAVLLLCCLTFVNCKPAKEKVESTTQTAFTLNDYYSNNAELEAKVLEVYNNMSKSERVAQMIMPAAGRLGKPDSTIFRLVREAKVGGVLLLNGDTASFTALVNQLNKTALENGLQKLIFSADAEPSLVNRKIKGTRPVPKTSEIKDIEELVRVTNSITEDIKKVGIGINFAPVIDLSTSNAAITNRSFGADSSRVRTFASKFIEVSQGNQVAATIKHFPGHGLVTGDTHSKLVYVDGDMKEVPVYKPLIDQGVILVMAGHIAVKNNARYDTDHQPATNSPVIINDLLKEELGFKGIVSTDALNMGAIRSVENVSFKAVEAGCDLILMPIDEDLLHHQIMSKLESDKAFEKRIQDSVQKIIRLKFCLGIIS